jgi:hypothetical protein
MKSSEDSLVTLPEQRGQEMLAHLLAPEMIGAVTPRQIAGVEIDPVRVGAAVDAELSRAGAGGTKGEAALQTVEIDPHRFEVDYGLGHDVPHRL